MRALFAMLLFAACTDDPQDPVACDLSWSARTRHSFEECARACQSVPVDPENGERCQIVDAHGLDKTCSGAAGLVSSFDGEQGCCVQRLEHAGWAVRWYGCEP